MPLATRYMPKDECCEKSRPWKSFPYHRGSFYELSWISLRVIVKGF
jgi:hypothetical protein